MAYSFTGFQRVVEGHTVGLLRQLRALVPSVRSPAGGIILGSPALLHVREEQTSGTQGGTFTSGAWRTRTLNTEVTNEITGASLASNQVTLPAGTYYVEGRAPAFAVNQHKAKIYDTTGTADLIVGLSVHAQNAGSIGTVALVDGVFTLSTTSVLELQHRCQTTVATNGLGLACSFSVVEVYGDLRIWKIA